jgi:hypothetical protein
VEPAEELLSACVVLGALLQALELHTCGKRGTYRRVYPQNRAWKKRETAAETENRDNRTSCAELTIDLRDLDLVEAIYGEDTARIGDVVDAAVQKGLDLRRLRARVPGQGE